MDHVQAGYPSITENAHDYFLEPESIARFYNHYVGDFRDGKDQRLAPLQAASLAGRLADQSKQANS